MWSNKSHSVDIFSIHRQKWIGIELLCLTEMLILRVFVRDLAHDERVSIQTPGSSHLQELTRLIHSMADIQEPSGTSHQENAYKFREMALGAGFALGTD
jgi:hypothetical protein